MTRFTRPKIILLNICILICVVRAAFVLVAAVDNGDFASPLKFSGRYCHEQQKSSESFTNNFAVIHVNISCTSTTTRSVYDEFQASMLSKNTSEHQQQNSSTAIFYVDLSLVDVHPSEDLSWNSLFSDISKFTSQVAIKLIAVQLDRCIGLMLDGASLSFSSEDKLMNFYDELTRIELVNMPDIVSLPRNAIVVDRSRLSLSCQELRISNTSLKHIDAQAFDSLQCASVEKLILNQNLLDHVPLDAIGIWHAIGTLDLSRNQIITVPPATWSDDLYFTDVTDELILSHNLVSTLPTVRPFWQRTAATIATKSGPAKIDLSHNRLDSVTVCCFLHDERNFVENLDVSHNLISKCCTDFIKPPAQCAGTEFSNSSLLRTKVNYSYNRLTHGCRNARALSSSDFVGNPIACQSRHSVEFLCWVGSNAQRASAAQQHSEQWDVYCSDRNATAHQPLSIVDYYHQHLARNGTCLSHKTRRRPHPGELFGHSDVNESEIGAKKHTKKQKHSAPTSATTSAPSTTTRDPHHHHHDDDHGGHRRDDHYHKGLFFDYGYGRLVCAIIVLMLVLVALFGIRSKFVRIHPQVMLAEGRRCRRGNAARPTPTRRLARIIAADSQHEVFSINGAPYVHTEFSDPVPDYDQVVRNDPAKVRKNSKAISAGSASLSSGNTLPPSYESLPTQLHRNSIDSKPLQDGDGKNLTDDAVSSDRVDGHWEWSTNSSALAD